MPKTYPWLATHSARANSKQFQKTWREPDGCYKHRSLSLCCRRRQRPSRERRPRVIHHFKTDPALRSPEEWFVVQRKNAPKTRFWALGNRCGWRPAANTHIFCRLKTFQRLPADLGTRLQVDRPITNCWYVLPKRKECGTTVSFLNVQSNKCDGAARYMPSAKTKSRSNLSYAGQTGMTGVQIQPGDSPPIQTGTLTKITTVLQPCPADVVNDLFLNQFTVCMSHRVSII